MPRYEVAPTAKVRQTQSDKWKKRPCVMRYRAFADRLRALGCVLKDNDAVAFHMEMPASWSHRKRAQMEGKPHRQRPDLDNLVGGLMDAIMPDSDSHISMLSSIRKVWARTPAIEISNPYAEPLPYALSAVADDQPETPLSPPGDIYLRYPGM